MTFEMKISDNLRHIRAVYDKRFQDQTARALEKALEQEITFIRLRTQQGRDVEGEKFAKYSKFTQALRKERGRNVTTVDLTFTGAMLRALRSKITRAHGYIEGVIFFIASERSKARRHNEGDPINRLPKRRFFGLSEEQVARITDSIRKALNG